MYFNGKPGNASWWMDNTGNPSDANYTRLWAYFYNNETHKWIEAKRYGSDNFYVEETETKDWTHVILTRHRGWVNSPAFDGNCLNKTGDINLNASTNNYLQNFKEGDANVSWWIIAPAPSGDPSTWSYEDEQICTSASGAKYVFSPKDFDYDKSKNHAWFKYNGSWTRLDGNEFRNNEGPQDYTTTLGEAYSDTYYFLQAGKPSACRLIRIRLDQNCDLGAPGACKITSFIAVASDANVTDQTCAVDGLVAFDDTVKAGDLMIWCDDIDTVTISNGNLEMPQTFKLKGFNASTTKTYTLHTKFLNGNEACESSCVVTVKPPTAPIMTHYPDETIGGEKLTRFTLEDITLTPDNQTSTYFQWTNSANDEVITTGDRNHTFPAPAEEQDIEYVFLASNDPPAPEGNLISNGTFEIGTFTEEDGPLNGKSYDEVLESNYAAWGRDNTGYYSSHAGASGGYAITDNASKFWHDYQNVAAHEGSYFGLFDSKISDGSDQAAWIAQSGDKNPKLKVQAGVSYLFSFWVANINAYYQMSNGARLQFQISYNGGTTWVNLGDEIDLGDFKDSHWHGRSSIATPTITSSEVAIRVINLNQSTVNIGNDFALDDIRFEAVTSHSSNIAAYERFIVKYLECKNNRSYVRTTVRLRYNGSRCELYD